MSETREVKAVLDLGLDPNAGRAMRELMSVMGKVSDSYNKIQMSAEKAAKAAAANRIVGPLTGSAADAANRARLAGGGKFMTPAEQKAAERERAGAMRGFKRLGVAAGIGNQVLGTAGAAVEAYGDQYSSDVGRDRAIAQSIPGVGHLLRTAEALNNREGMLTQARVVGAQQGLYGSQRVAGYGVDTGNLSQIRREALASATGGFGGVFGARFGRETATGERAFREQAQLLPIMREQAKTAREVVAANKEVTAAEKNELKIKDRLKTLETQRVGAMQAAARAEESGPPN
jgi:hypothetical protein